ncbi:hypothetical protein M0R45_019708 [Rubus argutus]|uniref:Uncharacterized protein n=1 Tax=Rubus argutus TaxID=59490 RepID=A0AAW1X7R1_RUBAR
MAVERWPGAVEHRLVLGSPTMEMRWLRGELAARLMAEQRIGLDAVPCEVHGGGWACVAMNDCDCCCCEHAGIWGRGEWRGSLRTGGAACETGQRSR